jgi:hypothetical protein
VGGKVSTQGRRGRTLVVRECRQPAAWELSSASSSIATSPTSAPPTLPNTPISPATGKMSQPVVQTIHRDPALLYVGPSADSAIRHN